jgi:hypothetical protein
MKLTCCYLSPEFRPSTSVADNTGAVAVQWLLAVADNILLIRAVLSVSLRILKKQICLKL